MSAPSTLDMNAIRDIFREPTTDNADAIATVDTDAVLDVDDIATLLRVGRNTVYALVAKNQIPHRRLGKKIRFSRVAVMSWLASWSVQVAKEGK